MTSTIRVNGVKANDGASRSLSTIARLRTWTFLRLATIAFLCHVRLVFDLTLEATTRQACPDRLCPIQIGCLVTGLWKLQDP